MIIKTSLTILILAVAAANTLFADMNILSKILTLLSLIPFLGIIILPAYDFFRGQVIGLVGMFFSAGIGLSLTIDALDHYRYNKDDMAVAEALKVSQRDCDLSDTDMTKRELEEQIFNSCTLGPVQALHNSVTDIFLSIHIPYEASPLAALLPPRNEAQINKDCETAYNEMRQLCPTLPKREFM
ncbi:hypothetical protein J8402_04255 [Chromohalobacter israelensis]|uniref:hypothetical protein n=1 Tax=Chromohalobacter israelensis TaxID=141390 RepID=UPI003AF9E101